MRRYAGQKALYEAMSRSRSKGKKRPSMLSRLRPQLEKLGPHLEKLRQIRLKAPKKSLGDTASAAEKPAPMVLKPPKPVEMPADEPRSPAQTWLRPKAIQYNDGRIEVSLPYQIGIIIGMGLVLIVLMGFWFGRRVGRIDERSRYNKQPDVTQADVGAAAMQDQTPQTAASEPTTAPQTTAEPQPNRQRAARAGRDAGGPVATGSNVIVLARHAVRSQLEPVQLYFREHGVETRILSYERLRRHFADNGLDASRLPQGDGYMLVTYNLYNNPDKEGTDGYVAKQRIIELGRGYEAPPNFESFATNRFSDAYGLKIAK